MVTVLDVFRMGGWTMFVILASTCLVLPLSLVHAFFARGWSLAIALVGVVLPCCCGGFGTLDGRATVDAAVEHADPQYRQLLQDEGYEEASYPFMFGACVAMLGIPLLGVGEIRRIRRNSKAAAAVEPY